MISREQIDIVRKQLGGHKEHSSPVATKKILDLAGYLDHYGIPYKVKKSGVVTLYVLEKCLFDFGHGKGEASIVQAADGKLFYQCFHESCRGRNWKEAREKISGKSNLEMFLRNSHMVLKKNDTAEHVDMLSQLFRWNDIADMDVSTEWLLEKLIPKRAITLVFCPGGGGKTWLLMQISKTIATGQPFGELQTVQSPVYFIDFENPLSVVKERCEKIGPADGFYYWHLACPVGPRKLDDEAWTDYKALPAGLLIFDTLRASHNSDENSSKDMALVLSRLKELREAGFTVVILHHTPKGNDGTYKGSTAILDLADHVLSLERQSKSDEEEFEPNSIFKFGCRIKTRFEPHLIFLTFDTERGFTMKDDPDIETMKIMRDILDREGPMKQKDFRKTLEDKLEMKKARIFKMLKKGTGRFWQTQRGQKDNAVIYSALLSSFPVVPPYKGVEN